MCFLWSFNVWINVIKKEDKQDKYKELKWDVVEYRVFFIIYLWCTGDRVFIHLGIHHFVWLTWWSSSSWESSSSNEEKSLFDHENIWLCWLTNKVYFLVNHVKWPFDHENIWNLYIHVYYFFCQLDKKKRKKEV
jgi:hypothetical protein